MTSPNLNDIATLVADAGVDATHPGGAAVIEEAVHRGVSPVLIAVVADATQAQVARQRAFGRLIVETTAARTRNRSGCRTVTDLPMAS